jgi:hypothetical protein
VYVPLTTSCCKFGIAEILIDKAGNMASRPADGTAAAIFGYDKHHYDYTRDYPRDVTQTVV